MVALLVLATCFYLLMVRSNPVHSAMRPWPWIALAVGLAIAATWYAPALLLARNSHLAGVFLAENLGHFLPASVGGTGEAARPLYYIALRIVGGSLPLSLLIPALALTSCLGGYAGNLHRQMLYQLAMALAVLVLFSAASAKRDDYILPALPPLAIMFAALFVGQEETSRGLAAVARNAVVAASAAAMLVGTLSVFILLRFGIGIGLLGSRLNSSDESYAAIFAYGLARLTPPFAIFLSAVAVGAIIALAGLYRRHPMVSGAGLALLSLAASTLWTGTLKPIEASTRSLAPFAAEVRLMVGDAQVYVAHDDPEFAWYFGRGVPALPRLIAASGPPSAANVYFVGRPRELALIAPPVRRQMRTILQSHVLGGGGAPAMYKFGVPQ
jgi:hypothetical protein